MKFIVVAYYTKNTIYEGYAKVFEESLKRFDIPFYVERIEGFNNWHKNCAYKPTFLKEMLSKFPDHNIVYVDIDAEFLAYPVLFDELDCDIAVHLLDRGCYKKKWLNTFELLSGTIFLKNNEAMQKMLDDWIKKCNRSPYTWDQIHLQNVIPDDHYILPGEYCSIFDKDMIGVGSAIIMHKQASREIRENKWKLK